MRFFLTIAIPLLAAGAFAQTSSAARDEYRARYTGVWAIGGSCSETTFVFAETFIERAGEDICEIEAVSKTTEGIRVIAACWHEFRSVGRSTYDFRLAPDGSVRLDNDLHPIKRCGDVPQELIDYYAPAKKP